jgi:hypothetical protein
MRSRSEICRARIYARAATFGRPVSTAKPSDAPLNDVTGGPEQSILSGPGRSGQDQLVAGTEALAALGTHPGESKMAVAGPPGRDGGPPVLFEFGSGRLTSTRQLAPQRREERLHADDEMSRFVVVRDFFSAASASAVSASSRRSSLMSAGARSAPIRPWAWARTAARDVGVSASVARADSAYFAASAAPSGRRFAKRNRTIVTASRTVHESMRSSRSSRSSRLCTLRSSLASTARMAPTTAAAGSHSMTCSGIARADPARVGPASPSSRGTNSCWSTMRRATKCSLLPDGRARARRVIGLRARASVPPCDVVTRLCRIARDAALTATLLRAVGDSDTSRLRSSRRRHAVSEGAPIRSRRLRVRSVRRPDRPEVVGRCWCFQYLAHVSRLVIEHLTLQVVGNQSISFGKCINPVVNRIIVGG